MPGASDAYPSHIPCAFVTVKQGKIVHLSNLNGDGDYLVRLHVEEQETWDKIDHLRRRMIKVWFGVDNPIFSPPPTITVVVPRNTRIYNNSSEGICHMSSTTTETPLQVGDNIGIYAVLRSASNHTATDAYHSLVFDCEAITTESTRSKMQ